MTALPGEVYGIPWSAIALGGVSIAIALIAPKLWRGSPKSWIWLGAGLCGWLAIAYFHLRLPTPQATDISHQLAEYPTVTITLQGEIETAPRLTRSQNVQFMLRSLQTVSQDANHHPVFHPVTGRVYTTLPLLQSTGLIPGDRVELSGSLYRPKPATDPGGFDFQAYLAQQGIFAGLRGETVTPAEVARSPWEVTQNAMMKALWAIRQQILSSQVTALGSPNGFLVSGMVLGRKAVDLPYDCYDQFVQAGLAHTLAASGFHVALVLGVVLKLTEGLPSKWRAGIGVGAIAFYTILTGFQASILRASLMGIGALVGMVAERRVQSLNLLVLVAILLLLYNPLWIWDLGFQLSFLATLGLLVTVPTLTRWLDWLPSAIATTLAVPLAAYMWTLPVQLYAFGTLSLYSIPVNVVVTPLIYLISLGGMASAAFSLVTPIVGEAIAWSLSLPTDLLRWLVEWSNQLPGSSYAVGKLSIPQLIALYSLFGLLWWRSQWQRYSLLVGIVGLLIVLIPIQYDRLNHQRFTVLATADSAAMVVQYHHQNGLIYAGDEADAQYQILPFLQQAGINHLDWAIAPQLAPWQLEGWYRLADEIPIHQFWSDRNPAVDASGEPTSLGQALVNRLQAQHGSLQTIISAQPVPLADALQWTAIAPNLAQFNTNELSWVISTPPIDPQTQPSGIRPESWPEADILWWMGETPTPNWQSLRAYKLAIASANSIDPNLEEWLQEQAISTYITGRDGAIQWQAQQGIQTTLGSRTDG
jgi:competence protein ComEC